MPRATGLSFECLLSTTNKMAVKRKVLVASLIFLSLVLLAAAFQCLGLLFCTLLIHSVQQIHVSLVHVSDNNKTIPQDGHFVQPFFHGLLTLASRVTRDKTLYMAKI